ncbi:hypothetical protein [Flavobacterium hydatis]|uniref:Uncharacterized protein n=1 Tax=Flavobacterium hydatis TaxID=991 RepID=A0ABX4CB58_FLAHY|nr:hypothetical protein [Flavobacterium hydatis]OXA90298.1 hypothetical protein B0A62_19700 [Flavobacterium hydatis]
MKKNITLIAFLFIVSHTFSQQIGDGLAKGINDFTTPLMSGVYGSIDPTIGGTPDISSVYQHLFVIRHLNPDNNHQLQIGASYSENDRLFFRKIARALTPANPSWIELATRGVNTFEGSQNINGTVKIQTANANYNENLRLLPSTVSDYSSIALGAVAGDLGTGIGQWTIVRYPQTYNYMFSLRYNSTDYFNILTDGNIGIGVTNPKNKLDVNGTIHSKEVKVDLEGWSDFVFKKEYKLPTLEEVEKHISEKGHLENIPSEEEALKNGINLGEMNAKLLQKIEELTLYTIQQSKEIQTLKEENKSFRSLSERLSKLEQQQK